MARLRLLRPFTANTRDELLQRSLSMERNSLALKWHKILLFLDSITVIVRRGLQFYKRWYVYYTLISVNKQMGMFF